NGDVCDGVETCSAASCQTGTPLDIDDGNACTIGSCDPISGVTQSPAPMGADCGNGNVCDASGHCLDQPILATQPRDVQVAVGQPFTLLVQASGSLLSYQWYKNGALIPGATSSTLTVPT